MNTLQNLVLKHKTDKSHHLNFIKYYEEYFSPLREKPVRILEIGVQKGYSIATWLEYFPKASIVGMDINPSPFPRDPRYAFVQGDQSDSKFLESVIRHHPLFDIVIDDGGHTNECVIVSFNSIWPSVTAGGLYCIEDLYCAYRPSYQRPGLPTQMEFIKGLLDDINNEKRGIASIHFSHELAIISKKA